MMVEVSWILVLTSSPPPSFDKLKTTAGKHDALFFYKPAELGRFSRAGARDVRTAPRQGATLETLPNIALTAHITIVYTTVI